MAGTSVRSFNDIISLIGCSFFLQISCGDESEKPSFRTTKNISREAFIYSHNTGKHVKITSNDISASTNKNDKHGKYFNYFKNILQLPVVQRKAGQLNSGLTLNSK